MKWREEWPNPRKESAVHIADNPAKQERAPRRFGSDKKAAVRMMPRVDFGLTPCLSPLTFGHEGEPETHALALTNVLAACHQSRLLHAQADRRCVITAAEYNHQSDPRSGLAIERQSPRERGERTV